MIVDIGQTKSKCTAIEVANFLDKLLIDSADPMDKSLNGLQVDAGATVTKVGVAVDSCLSTFELAKEKGCQMVITHHGLYWSGGEHRIIGLMGDRGSYLIRNNISLWSCHIPIDRHPKFGNNAGLADIVGIDNRQGFSDYHGSPIGLYGQIKNKKSINEIALGLSESLPSCNPLLWDFGCDDIQTIGIVSGGGAFAIEDAKKLNLDLLITGEVGHSDFHTAKEHKINVISAGHWATETVGIKLVGDEITKRLGIETQFISVPTGM